MQIVSDHIRVEIEEMLEMRDALLVRTQRFEVFQVADVMTDEGIVFPSQAERVLQLCAAGENLLRGSKGAANRRGRITARASQDHGAFLKHARDGIVRSHVYAPVVQQERIGD